MKSSGHLGQDVDLHELAKRTKNYSGSEIAGVVRSATSFALGAGVSGSDLQQLIADIKKRETVVVTRAHFECALGEVKGAFGADESDLEKLAPNGIFPRAATAEVLESGAVLAAQVRESELTPLVSVLLSGRGGAGTTALAAEIARRSGFPFVKVVCSDDLVGRGDLQKVNMIFKVFDDAYKSKNSVVIVDNIEQIVEYVGIGPRFNNGILQTLKALLKKLPPPEHKLLIIGTTSDIGTVETVELKSAFDEVLDVPNVRADEVDGVLQCIDGCKESPAVREQIISSLGDLSDGIPVKHLIFKAASIIAQNKYKENQQ